MNKKILICDEINLIIIKRGIGTRRICCDFLFLVLNLLILHIKIIRKFLFIGISFFSFANSSELNIILLLFYYSLFIIAGNNKIKLKKYKLNY